MLLFFAILSGIGLFGVSGIVFGPLLLLALVAGHPACAESFSVLSQNMNHLFDDVDDGNREKILASAEFRRRIAGAVRHPNVIDVTDMGQHDGVPASLAADAPVSAADGVTRSSPPWLEFVLEPLLHAVVLPSTRTSVNSRNMSRQ